MGKPPLRVMIVDDSATVRRFLTSLIDEAPDMVVVGEARDGEEAIRQAARLNPDIISMDIQMPHLDGLTATTRLMQQNPRPIVIVSARMEGREAVDLAFLALQAGALAVLKPPPHHRHPGFAEGRDQFLNTLRAMAGVRVVRRWASDGGPPTAAPVTATEAALEGQPALVAIGASAGGPMALYEILSKLPADFPVPLVIVQHMADGFIEGLIRWLDRSTPLSVFLAEQGHILQPGEVVIAGTGSHLAVQPIGSQVRLVLKKERGPFSYYPSVDVLFESVAVGFGAQAVGVLLTGMGDDGARGLRTLREAGARTLAQDRTSCLVYGMPGAAVALGAAEQVVPLTQIAPLLQGMVKAVPNQQDAHSE